jgi:Ca2+-transporting ATPase
MATSPHPAADAHAQPVAGVAAALGSDADRGLSVGEVRARRARYGPNLPRQAARPAYTRIAARQVLDPLVALLACAAAVSVAVGEGVEAIVIGAIVVLNAVLGFVEEAGAERAVLALRARAAARASVVRDGREEEVDSADLVPGDLVVLREGDRVPADARVVSAQGLAVEEAALTGESYPVEKAAAPVAPDTPLAERASMVFAGTAVTRGRARGLVVSTGEETEMGGVARLTAEAAPPAPPLTRRIRALARTMAAGGVLVTVVLAMGAWLHGSSPHEAFLVGVSVAVAAVPEGLAATLTIALALGARRMAARGAIVRRLSAIETIGETTVICADKTGTLTENRLRVAALALPDGREVSTGAAAGADAGARALLAGAALASTAELADGPDGPRVTGDPVDGAMLLAAHDAGIDPRALRRGRAVVAEIPFDPERRRLTVVYDGPRGREAFTKGAHEEVLRRAVAAHVDGTEVALTDAGRDGLDRLARDWAARGLRVLAVARRGVDHDEAGEDAERNLVLLGLVGLEDPLRPAAARSIREAGEAGLATLVLTGDHPRTAEAVARRLGIPDPRPLTGRDIDAMGPEALDDALARRFVFARVTPADKLRLVVALQGRGEIVAATGDGVNDAPALRRADVGIAMGLSGTEAAREASSIVLTDDDFSTIVSAVGEGRRTAENVRKFVAFLLSANLGEVILFGIAVLGGLGAPMGVVQVLLVNLVTDGLPAIALARDPASSDLMRREGFGARLFTPALRVALGVAGLAVGLAALAAFLIGREVAPDAAETMAFATLALSELAFVFSCRSPEVPAWRGGRNLWLVGGVLASVGVVALAIYLPGGETALGTVSLGVRELGVVLGLSAVPFLVAEVAKRVSSAWRDTRVAF